MIQQPSPKQIRPFLLLLLLTLIACGGPPVGETAVSSAPTIAPSTETATAVPDPAGAATTASPSPTGTIPPAATATATATATLPPPTFSNPPLATLAETAQAQNVPLRRLNSQNSGVWQYAPGSFYHPLALAVAGDTAYLLDGGRVLALALDAPAPPTLLLAPGDEVDGLRVLEPLDLAHSPGTLWLLDRAGDVYRYDLAAERWSLVRHDRSGDESASHYYVAIAGTASGYALLETNYRYLLHQTGNGERLWEAPPGRGVDIDGYANIDYVLRQNMDDERGVLYRFREMNRRRFSLPLDLDRPRQVAATQTAVFVLDQDGRRLLTLDPDNGRLQQITQLPPHASAVWSDGERLIVAGRGRLYFPDQPARLAHIPGGPILAGPQPHDPLQLAALPPLRLPIGLYLAASDLQLPGAPRHYRLGVHQGIDLYWRRGRPVTAVAAGVVVRADHDYSPPSGAEFARRRAESAELGYTSDAALDFYRGRQVWIRHENGILSRYAHLDSIDPAVVEGTAVSQGQVIGAVGNSGSPSSLIPNQPDTHVHVDVWLGDHYLGQFLRPVETRAWLTRIFDVRR